MVGFLLVMTDHCTASSTQLIFIYKALKKQPQPKQRAVLKRHADIKTVKTMGKKNR